MDSGAGAWTSRSRASSSLGVDENDFYNYSRESQLSSSPELDHADDMRSGVDGERKSAFYDYKQEKTLRQADAKLFYQQQQQQHQQQQASGWNSPVMRSSTWGGGANISRTASVRSFTSSHYPHSVQNTPGAAAAGNKVPANGLASLDKPKEHTEVQGPGMGRFDPYGILDSAGALSTAHHLAPQNGVATLETQGGYADRECKAVEAPLRRSGDSCISR